MPRVPISNRQVAERPFQAVQKTASLPVAQRVQGLESLGNSLVNLEKSLNNEQEAAKAQAYKLELDSFKNDLRNKKNQLLHDKEFGYTNTRGRQALDSFDSKQKEYDDYINERLGSLKNEEIKQLASIEAQPFKTEYSLNLNQHAGKEHESLKDQTYIATLESLKDDAILNSGDASKLGETLGRLSKEVDAYGKRKGMDAAAINELKTQKKSEVHLGLINRFINNGDDLTAQTYLNQFSKDMDADSVMKAEGILRTASIKGESQRIVDEAMKLGKGYQESIDYVREKAGAKGPEVVDAATTRFKDRYNEKKFAEKEQDREAFQSAMDQLDEMKTLDHLPPEEMNRLSEKKKSVLRKVHSLIAKGVEPKTDPVIYQDLILKASTPELQQDFLQVDINEYAHKLSTADRKQLLGMRKAIVNKDGSYDDKFGKILSDSAVINQVLDEIGVSRDNKDDRAKFTNLVMEQAVAWERVNKKTIPNDELNKIANRFGMKVVTDKGFLWDSTKRLYEAEEFEGIKFNDIPARDRQLLQESMQRSNIPFSEATAEKIYIDFLKGSIK